MPRADKEDTPPIGVTTRLLYNRLGISVLRPKSKLQGFLVRRFCRS